MAQRISKSPFYLGHSNLKNSNVDIEWNAEKLKEYKKCMKDPIYFCENYVYIINVDLGKIKFVPYEYQKRMVRTICENRFSIAKLARQAGKTTIVSAILLWYVLFNSDFKIALLAHKDSGAQEILERIKLAFEMLPDWLQQGVVEWNKRSVQFENGSIIETAATSSGSIRGKSFNIVYLDEFAHVEQNVQEEFFTSTYPVITSGTTTKIMITSTPNGMEMFYKIWEDSLNDRNNYVRFEAHWSEKPGRDEAWKAETIRNTSARQFEQEFETHFLGSTNTLIDGWKLRNMVWHTPISDVKDSLKVYIRPEKGHKYACAVDTSEGLGQDYHAFCIVDVTRIPYKLCAMYRNNTVHPLLLPNIIYNTAKQYNEAVILVETQSTGAQTARILLHDLEYDNILFTTNQGNKGTRIGGGSGQRRLGVMMNKMVKRIGCTNLKSLIESDKLLVHDYNVIMELNSFVADKEKYAAEEGHYDDTVMSLVVFAWMVSQNYFKEEMESDVRTNLYEDNEKEILEYLLPFGFINDGRDEDEWKTWE